MSEVVLTVLPGDSPEDRVAVVMDRESGATTIRLCQQSFSDAVGWFTQSSISLTPQQFGSLRQTLGGLPATSGPGQNSGHRRRGRPAGNLGVDQPILAFPA